MQDVRIHLTASASDPMGFWKSGQQEVNTCPKQAWIVPEPAGAPTDVACFLDCIEQNRESDMPASRAAEGIEVLAAACRSASTGEVVRL